MLVKPEIYEDVTIVTPQYNIDNFVNKALYEVGYQEKKTSDSNYLYHKNANPGTNNFTKYAADLIKYKFYKDSKQGTPWNEVFAYWCASQLVSTSLTSSIPGLLNRMFCVKGDYGADTKKLISSFNSSARFGNLPTKGAIVFLSPSVGKYCVGIVTSCNDSTVTYVAGDIKDQVVKEQLNRNSSTIVGYGYPDLTNIVIPETASTPSVVLTNSLGEAVSYNSENTQVTLNKTYNGLKYSDTNPPLYCSQSQGPDYKTTTQMTVKGVLWHSTGCENSYIKRYVQPDDNSPNKDYWLKLLGKNPYNNDWNHIEVGARLNAFIGRLDDGSVTTVQTTEWTRKPGGCYYSYNGSCNNGWIQFEICEDDLKSEEYFNQVYEEACQLTAYLCRKFKLNPRGTVDFNGVQVPVILDHSTSYSLGFGSNHADVGHWFSRYGKSMETVRNDVEYLLNIASNSSDKENVIINVVNKGDIVTVKSGAVSKDGQKAASFITNHRWLVADESQEYATLGARTDSNNTVILNKEYHKNDLVVTSAEGSVGSSTNHGTVTDEERIWNLLSSKIKNPYGVAGVMGNMMAESGLKPNNLQDAYESSLGYTDDTYTAAVDNGTYTNFVYDSAGYGLVQWTFYTLKEYLLNYAQKKGTSIGDLDMQVECLCDQLETSYNSIWTFLCSATSVKEASDKILHEFERPADQSVSVENKRASYGQNFYDKYSSACIHENTVLKEKVDVSCTQDGYSGDKVCSSCGQTVEFGAIIPAKGHTLNSAGICSVCGCRPGSEDGESGLVTRQDLLSILAFLKDMLKREG